MKDKWKEKREREILAMIPPEVKTVLDIGSRFNIFKKYDTKTVDILEEANVVLDLNKNQKLPLKTNSIDLVVMNQILEHLAYVEEIIEESKRVSKKYIFIGLPNEITWWKRIRNLIGRPSRAGYLKYSHKHYYTIPTIEKFILDFFNGYTYKKYVFMAAGGQILPERIKRILARIAPGLFCGEAYYLIDINKIKKKA